MAEFVFTDAVVEVNNVVLTDHVRAVTLTTSAELHEDTAMGDTFRSRIAGLQDWSVMLEFNQDFAATEPDVTLQALVGAAAFSMKIRPTSSAISATNPEYTGNVVLAEYPIMDGSVGDLATTSVTFQGAGTLTRDITP